MKKVRPRCMAVILLTGLFLCGCGGDPAEDMRTPPRAGQDEKEKQVYVEQSVQEIDKQDEPVAQNVWQYSEIYMYQTGNGVPYIVKNLRDGSVQQDTCTWEQNWEKKFKKKFIMLESWQKINDKVFYVVAAEYSMDPEKFFESPEKYEDDFYVVHCYLLRLDDETGEIQEIPTLQMTNKEYYKETGRTKPMEMNEKDLFFYTIKVMPDGNFLLSAVGENYICDGVTGEKLVDLDLDTGTGVGIFTAVGDGFIAAVTEDFTAKKCELHVFDSNTGTKQYSVPLDFEEREINGETAYVNFALGASEDSILIVYDKCIYKMDYGDEQLEKVLDADEGKMFYLPDEEYIYEAVCMGESDDYFVKMMKESENYQDRICHYFKKGADRDEE